VKDVFEPVLEVTECLDGHARVLAFLRRDRRNDSRYYQKLFGSSTNLRQLTTAAWCKVPIQNMPEAKASLRNASLCCLAIWAAVWLLFLVMRFTPFDIREIPGIGPIMLAALGVALLAPVTAIGLAGAALVRQPRASLNWLALGCALTAMFGQGLLFIVTRWL